MPDGDKVHKKLHGYYQKPYKMLCEPQFDKIAVAFALLQAIKADLRSNGGIPIEVLKLGIGEMPNGVPEALINWPQISYTLDTIVQVSLQKKLIKDVTCTALKTNLNRLRIGCVKTVGYADVAETFLSKMYSARFADKVFCTPKHYHNASSDVVSQRLSEITPLVREGLSKMAGQNKPVPSIPRVSFKRQQISADTDLTAL